MIEAIRIVTLSLGYMSFLVGAALFILAAFGSALDLVPDWFDKQHMVCILALITIGMFMLFCGSVGAN